MELIYKMLKATLTDGRGVIVKAKDQSIKKTIDEFHEKIFEIFGIKCQRQPDLKDHIEQRSIKLMQKRAKDQLQKDHALDVA